MAVLKGQKMGSCLEHFKVILGPKNTIRKERVIFLPRIRMRKVVGPSRRSATSMCVAGQAVGSCSLMSRKVALPFVPPSQVIDRRTDRWIDRWTERAFLLATSD